jgi:hypothetical protein
LEKKYGIQTTIYKSNQYTQIYVPKAQFFKFKKIVYPFFEKSMMYKLGENS